MNEDITTNNGKTVNFLSNYVPITIFNTKVYALLDSGSDICVANYNVMKKYKIFDECTIEI